MTSNGLSSRRAFFRRPKVCKSHPNPGRCEPPPPPQPLCTCSVSPALFTVEIDDSDTLDISGCLPHLPEGSSIELSGTCLYGHVDEFGPNISNCDDVATRDYYPPDFECVDTINFILKFTDGRVCHAYATAHVLLG